MLMYAKNKKEIALISFHFSLKNAKSGFATTYAYKKTSVFPFKF